MSERILQYKEVRKCFPDKSGLPVLPGEMHVYLFGEVPEGVRYHCPCGCGSLIYTPVCIGEKAPGDWLFSRGPDGPTLFPSIRWTCGCKAHFNIENGKTIIHADSGK